MTSGIFSWIDSLFDRAAERLAENMVENVEVFEQNKASRERANTGLRHHQQQCEHVTPDSPLPWHAVYTQIPVSDLKRSLVFLQDKIEYRPQEMVLFLA